MGQDRVDRIRLVIVDDHAMVREGTRGMFEQFPDLQVVGEAGDGLVALDLIRQIQPDVALLDIRLPRLNGIEVARQIARLAPATKALILTAYDDDDYIAAAMQAGARGYLLKTAPLREVAEAVRAVSHGEIVLHPTIARKVAAFWSRGGSASAGELAHRFTPRETEVLRLLTEGRRNKEIAHDLGISVRTVEGHLMNIFTKMGVSSRTAAALQAGNSFRAGEDQESIDERGPDH
ncbi:MAG: response regulator transcription factor [Chloroflexi bacterium]|nr:response regulator transcription factor [Chloroflexota bacterium]